MKRKFRTSLLFVVQVVDKAPIMKSQNYLN